MRPLNKLYLVIGAVLVVVGVAAILLMQPPAKQQVELKDGSVLTLDREGHLYKTTFDNPHPTVAVPSIDFASRNTSVAPFLIAITVE